MNWRTIYRLLVFGVALVAGGVAFRVVLELTPKTLPREISPAEFLSEVAQGHVASILVSEHTEISGESSTIGRFVTTMKVDRTVVNNLRERGVRVEFERFYAAP